MVTKCLHYTNLTFGNIEDEYEAKKSVLLIDIPKTLFIKLVRM